MVRFREGRLQAERMTYSGKFFKTWQRAAVVLLWATALLSGSLSARTRQVLLASTEYPPYMSPRLDHDGPMGEIIREAYGRVGYHVRFRYFPWSRALREARTGALDGITVIWHTPERARDLLFSLPLPGNELAFYKWQDRPPERFRNYAQLKDYRIGVVRGYATPPGFAEAGLTTEAVTEDVQNLSKLALHRLDLALLDRNLARYLLQTRLPQYQGKLVPLEPAVAYLPLFVAISRKAEDAQSKLAAFDRGLRMLYREGRVTAIMHAHGL